MGSVSFVLALMIVMANGELDGRHFSGIEFRRMPGPGSATTLRQYYQQINALSADPVLNGSVTLVT